MKARLISSSGTLQLLLCNGVIKYITQEEAKDFLLTFDNVNHYKGPGTWDYEGITMESYTGHTIALVDNKGVLRVSDANMFRKLLSQKEEKILTVPEYAALHGKKPGIVRRFCLQGRIEGAIQKGSQWLIPESAPYPISE